MRDYEDPKTPASQLSACRWSKRGWTLRKHRFEIAISDNSLIGIYRRIDCAYFNGVLRLQVAFRGNQSFSSP
jgi:hypothetical protein